MKVTKLNENINEAFGKGASIATQQSWEDEMNEIDNELGYGNPSDRRRERLSKRYDKLEQKFAKQRDLEARHPERFDNTPALKPNEEKEPVLVEGIEHDAVQAIARYEVDIPDMYHYMMDKSHDDYMNNRITADKYAGFLREMYNAIESVKSPFEEALGIGAGLALGGAAIGAGMVGSALVDDLKSSACKECDDKEKLTEKSVEDYEKEYEDQKGFKSCDKCGTRLNEMGTCPKCDDGEEDLDEGLIGDVNVNLDASGSSVGFLGGTAGLTNECKETKEDKEPLTEKRDNSDDVKFRRLMQLIGEDPDAITESINDEDAEFLTGERLRESVYEDLEWMEDELGTDASLDERVDWFMETSKEASFICNKAEVRKVISELTGITESINLPDREEIDNPEEFDNLNDIDDDFVLDDDKDFIRRDDLQHSLFMGDEADESEFDDFDDNMIEY